MTSFCVTFPQVNLWKFSSDVWWNSRVFDHFRWKLVSIFWLRFYSILYIDDYKVGRYQVYMGFLDSYIGRVVTGVTPVIHLKGRLIYRGYNLAHLVEMLPYFWLVVSTQPTHLKKYADLKMGNHLSPILGMKMKQNIWNHQPDLDWFSRSSGVCSLLGYLTIGEGHASIVHRTFKTKNKSKFWGQHFPSRVDGEHISTYMLTYRMIFSWTQKKSHLEVTFRNVHFSRLDL